MLLAAGSTQFGVNVSGQADTIDPRASVDLCATTSLYFVLSNLGETELYNIAAEISIPAGLDVVTPIRFRTLRGATEVDPWMNDAAYTAAKTSHCKAMPAATALWRKPCQLNPTGSASGYNAVQIEISMPGTGQYRSQIQPRPLPWLPNYHVAVTVSNPGGNGNDDESDDLPIVVQKPNMLGHPTDITSDGGDACAIQPIALTVMN